jgi:hypothetical protein
MGRLQLPQRRAQRIKPRGVRKSVAYDALPDGRCHRGKLGGGEVTRSARSFSIGDIAGSIGISLV